MESETTSSPTSETPPPKDQSLPIEAKSRRKIPVFARLVFVLSLAVIIGYFLGQNKPKIAHSAVSQTQKTVTTPTVKVAGLQLDTSKNYGNKYSNGLVPVGDSKYVTDAPKVGYVYACQQYAQNFGRDRGGAGSRGPWFTNNNSEYDLSKKSHISGAIGWSADFSSKFADGKRVISTNGLPSHTTGVFPIKVSDPAYAYDRNPNSIKTQSLTYNLDSTPVYGTPNCMGGEVGIMNTGVPLLNAFDAGGRDAGAWEIQDSCGGHPQKEGEYHYHSLSSCIKDTSVHTVIGYALDGFPITGPQVSLGNILTTSELDECHGLTSQVNVEDKSVLTYHYVMTQDFPYSASCFRSTASQPPGMPQKP